RIDLAKTPFVSGFDLPDPFAPLLNEKPELARSDRTIRPDTVPGVALTKDKIEPYFKATENSRPQLSPDGRLVLYNYFAGGYVGLRMYVPALQKHLELLPPDQY